MAQRDPALRRQMIRNRKPVRRVSREFLRQDRQVRRHNRHPVEKELRERVENELSLIKSDQEREAIMKEWLKHCVATFSDAQRKVQNLEYDLAQARIELCKLIDTTVQMPKRMEMMKYARIKRSVDLLFTLEHEIKIARVPTIQ